MEDRQEEGRRRLRNPIIFRERLNIAWDIPQSFRAMGRHVTGMSATAWLFVLACFVFCWISCSAASLHMDTDRKPWMDEMESNLQNDIYISELVNRLRALNDAEVAGLAQKRGFDFGLGRGFSATQAAKHKMGLAAAAFPSGPGRRRRSVEQTLRH